MVPSLVKWTDFFVCLRGDFLVCLMQELRERVWCGFVWAVCCECI